MGFEIWQPGIQILAAYPGISAPLGKLLDHAKLQFLHLENEDNYLLYKMR